jgi:hypothetical protein
MFIKSVLKLRKYMRHELTDCLIAAAFDNAAGIKFETQEALDFDNYLYYLLGGDRGLNIENGATRLAGIGHPPPKW